MAFCTECGAQLPEGSKFCAQCGAGVPARQEAAAATSGRVPGADGATRVATLAAEAFAYASVVEAPDAAGEFVAGMWNDDALSTGEEAAAQVAQGAAQQVQTLQPNARRPSDGAAPEPKKKSKLPLVIVAAVAVVLFAVYVVPLFIPNPHDPHEDMVLTSETAASPLDESSALDVANGSTESEAASPSTPEESEAASPSAPVAPNEPAVPRSFSTDERPQLIEFTWLTSSAAKGIVPEGATRLTGFEDVEGGWKAYLYSGDSEWLLNTRFDSVQDGAAVTIDWYYLRIGGVSEEVREDDTPDELFNGSWSGGTLDATGSGRITIAAFWEKDGRQYATGSFMWSSGETGTIALVRP